MSTVERLRDDALRFLQQEELPSSMEWAQYLSPLNARIFAVELADELRHAELTGDLEHLVILLEDWQATAEFEGSPLMRAAMERRGQYRPLESFDF